MLRTMIALAVAGLVFTAVSGTSQAAPIAPLTGVTAPDSGNLTKVYWHHRHCWIGRWGHRHCAW
jgi:hypothetical protein